jgi:hypothetical protein
MVVFSQQSAVKGSQNQTYYFIRVKDLIEAEQMVRIVCGG